MTEPTDADWLAGLPEAARERYHATVAELRAYDADPDMPHRVRVDMEQPHAPLALETLLRCVHPGEWTVDPGCAVRELLRRDTLAWQEQYGSGVGPGRDAVGRMLAAGASYGDLAAFAYLVAAAKIEDMAFSLAQGQFYADLPGWRLMETWRGRLTGRPLSIWGVYQAEGEVILTIRPNPSITDRPLTDQNFWELMRQAVEEQDREDQGHGHGRGQRSGTPSHREELGRMVLALLATLAGALEHANELGSGAPPHSVATSPSNGGAMDPLLRSIIAVPMRTAVAVLAAIATSPSPR